jgi:uncharacterized damage-inducible protein DinB
MKTLCLLTLAMAGIAAAQSAAPSCLITMELAPGMDIRTLTPEQKAVFAQHGQFVASLEAKGLIVGGRTSEPVGTLAFFVLAADEATAKDVIAGDPATKAGYVKSAVRPLSLLLPPAPPAVLVSDTKLNYDMASKYLLAAAKKMPDDRYSFRPAPDVRTFGQLVGHIAESQYIACDPIRGKEYKPHNLERGLNTKADLVAALETAVGYCQETWTTLKPGALADKVKLFNRDRTKLGVLDIATAHAFEHYGNMVTYLRMNGVVPPSSE